MAVFCADSVRRVREWGFYVLLGTRGGNGFQSCIWLRQRVVLAKVVVKKFRWTVEHREVVEVVGSICARCGGLVDVGVEQRCVIYFG